MNFRSRRFRKLLRAQIRYGRILLSEFRYTLVSFMVLLCLGTFLFHSSNPNLSYVEGLYQTFVMITLQPIEPFPKQWYLQLFAFIILILGLSIFAEGIVRFSLLLFAKHHNEKEWIMAMVSTYRNHTILVGLGNVGYRIYENLKPFHIDVVAIEMDDRSPFVEILTREGVPVVTGDARKEEFLKMVGVEKARNLLAVTNDDLTNLEVAIDARRLNPQIVVFLRMFDENFAKKIQGQFDFRFVFSTSALAAPVVAGMVMDPTVKNAFYIGDQLILTAELIIHHDLELIGKTIGEFPMIHVLSIQQHSNTRFFPSPSTVLDRGDRITVQTTPRCLEELHPMNAKTSQPKNT